MDARIEPLADLGLSLGDVHVMRNAGGRVTDDVLRSLIVSAHLLGTREAGVIHHTGCGLEGRTDDEVAAVVGRPGFRALTFADLDESVRADVAEVRTCGDLPAGYRVWGAVIDVDDGSLRVVVT